MQYKILYYKSSKNICPVLEWIDSLDNKTQQRILVRLDRVKEGNLGYFRNLSRGINELKFNFGGGCRIYFSILKNEVILLLCGGNKATQKRDIKKARLYFKDYKNE